MLERVKDPKSSLYEAQIIPNVYLPNTQSGREMTNLWTQIGCLGHATPNFADVIERTCAQLDETISQSKLEQLGETFVNAYGDLNQKRGELHAKRVRDMRASLMR